MAKGQSTKEAVTRKQPFLFSFSFTLLRRTLAHCKTGVLQHAGRPCARPVPDRHGKAVFVPVFFGVVALLIAPPSAVLCCSSPLAGNKAPHRRKGATADCDAAVVSLSGRAATGRFVSTSPPTGSPFVPPSPPYSPSPPTKMTMVEAADAAERLAKVPRPPLRRRARSG